MSLLWMRFGFQVRDVLALRLHIFSVSNMLSNALAVEAILVALWKTHLTRHFPRCMIAIDKRMLLSFIMAQHMGPCIEQHVYDAFDVEKVNPCISDASVARWPPESPSAVYGYFG